MEIGPDFKMTLKTKLFLWLYRGFNKIAQWFICHCDTEPHKPLVRERAPASRRKLPIQNSANEDWRDHNCCRKTA